MTTRHTTTEDLRAALESAMVGMTEEQARAARELLDALTPPMEEPKWPGAPVIAACILSVKPSLHTRCNSSSSRWECKFRCISIPWRSLIKPRPLTPEEYAEHGIPMPCEPVTDELVKHIKSTGVVRAVVPLYDHEKDSMVRAVLRAAGHPAAGE